MNCVLSINVYQEEESIIVFYFLSAATPEQGEYTGEEAAAGFLHESRADTHGRDEARGSA